MLTMMMMTNRSVEGAHKADRQEPAASSVIVSFPPSNHHILMTILLTTVKMGMIVGVN